MVSSVKCHYHSVMSGAMVIFPGLYEAWMWVISSSCGSCLGNTASTCGLSLKSVCPAGPSKGKFKHCLHLYTHVLVPHQYICDSSERRTSTSYHSRDRITSDILILVKKKGFPFFSSRTNLPLPLSTVAHTKPSGSKDDKEEGCWIISILCQREPLQWVTQKPSTSLKQLLASVLKIKIPGTRS